MFVVLRARDTSKKFTSDRTWQIWQQCKYWGQDRARQARHSLEDFVRSGKRLLLVFWKKYQFLVFVLLFFAIWHPCLNIPSLPQTQKQTTAVSFAIPQRPHIYPVEHIALRLEMRRQWLSLWMGAKEVAAFPLHKLYLPAGNYRLTRLLPVENRGILGCMENGQDTMAVIRSSNTSSSTQFFIELDSDFWEMIYPYLRISTPVHVE